MADTLERMSQAMPWTQDQALVWWEEHAPEMLWTPPTTRQYASLERTASEQPATQPTKSVPSAVGVVGVPRRS